jgi:hypothetical protein
MSTITDLTVNSKKARPSACLSRPALLARTDEVIE